MMGLSRPPAAPGGGVISVNTWSERPLKPSQTRTPRMSTSQPRPNSVAAQAKPIMRLLRRRRPALSLLVRAAMAMTLPDPALDAHQHVARDRQHDEGDEKQDEPE